MTETKFNTELAERVLAQIKDHPETWEQSTWDCGTTACFAGWAVRLAHRDNPSMVLDHAVGRQAGELLGLLDRGKRWQHLFLRSIRATKEDTLDVIEHLVKHYANNPDDDSLPS